MQPGKFVVGDDVWERAPPCARVASNGVEASTDDLVANVRYSKPDPAVGPRAVASSYWHEAWGAEQNTALEGSGGIDPRLLTP
jgi:hypothetical protein